ncbi:MAG: hypothetical protein WD359_04240 [Dehalococcoidia bacterium]
MKNWNRLGIGIAAVVLAVAAAGGAYAIWGGDDGGDDPSASQSDQDANSDGANGGVSAICIEGTVDCQDTPLGGDRTDSGAAGGTCLEGTGDCIDTPFGDQRTDGGLAMCAPGVTDCVDVVVGEDAYCAPDRVCAEPDVLCDNGYDADGCAAPEVSCVPPQPALNPEATLTPEEERAAADCVDNAPPDCDDTARARCLPPDCAVSSDGAIACPQDQGAGTDGSSGGAGSSANPGTGEQVEPVEPNAGAPR